MIALRCGGRGRPRVRRGRREAASTSTPLIFVMTLSSGLNGLAMHQKWIRVRHRAMAEGRGFESRPFDQIFSLRSPRFMSPILGKTHFRKAVAIS